MRIPAVFGGSIYTAAFIVNVDNDMVDEAATVTEQLRPEVLDLGRQRIEQLRLCNVSRNGDALLDGLAVQVQARY